MPHFPTDLIQRRARKSAGRPESGTRGRGSRQAERRRCAPQAFILLYTETAGRQLIVNSCGRSAAAGVRPGMTVAHARALLPSGEVMIEPHRPQRDLAALEALARWALRFSPLVAVDPPDGLAIDIAGCERLFGGARRLVDRIGDETRRLGLTVRIASAPTFACAWAVARFGAAGSGHVAEGGERAALSGLPVTALRVDEAVAEALREVGIERIGHLLDLPRSSLATRFGSQLVHRLDQSVGEAAEVIDPVRPAEPPAVERVFTGPVTQIEAIEITVRELLDEMSRDLAQRECGVRQMVLGLDRLDAEPLSVTVALGRPSREARHLWTLLAPRIESANLGWGVERVSLVATRCGRLPHRDGEWTWAPGGCGDDGRAQRLFGELLDTLSNRLGVDRVVRVEPVESHLPERTFRLRPALEEKGDKSHFRRAESPLRPSLLLERPEPIAVIAMTPDGPPSWFRWRGMEQRVTASAGPERIAGEWWRGGETGRGAGAQGPAAADRLRGAGKRFGESYARAYGRFLLGREYHPPSPQPQTLKPQASSLKPPSTRDYFKVQDEAGRWLWIYRVLESSQWFVHGLWA